jgi:hypothetical protein
MRGRGSAAAGDRSDKDGPGSDGRISLCNAYGEEAERGSIFVRSTRRARRHGTNKCQEDRERAPPPASPARACTGTTHVRPPARPPADAAEARRGADWGSECPSAPGSYPARAVGGICSRDFRSGAEVFAIGCGAGARVLLLFRGGFGWPADAHGGCVPVSESESELEWGRAASGRLCARARTALGTCTSSPRRRGDHKRRRQGRLVAVGAPTCCRVTCAAPLHGNGSCWRSEYCSLQTGGTND